MIPLQVVVLLFVAAAGTAVVLSRDLVRMAIVASLYALLLVVLFVVFQAPDVALSELVVGAVGYPLVLLAAIARSRARDDR
jgi:energy-converting hydrogenase B subunit D